MIYLIPRDHEVPGGLTPQTQVGQSGGHTSGMETSTRAETMTKTCSDAKSMS